MNINITYLVEKSNDHFETLSSNFATLVVILKTFRLEINHFTQF